jgi:D-alanyl-lipoteichoic acid acyltransferase DltB (MBOAT superfamily)
VYRRRLEPVKKLADFALFVAFFPHMVAGPIMRSDKLIPQVLSPRRLQEGDFTEGLYLVLIGMFKKVVVADTLAGIVAAVFGGDPAKLSGPEALMGVYAFAVQIYCDFSGYSSIAQGIAKWLGFSLMTNFNTPYFATTPSDFWGRWHISLSTWLRDYLYVPLGGNRGGTRKTYRNLLLTMLLGGLWHGAAWTFVAWGAWHGLLLCLYRPFERAKNSPAAQTAGWKRFIAAIVLFHLVCVGWVLFRASSMSQFWAMMARMCTDFQFTPLARYYAGMILFFAGPLLVFEYLLYRKADLLYLIRTRWVLRGAAYSYMALMMWFLAPEAVHEFIYFQF